MDKNLSKAIMLRTKLRNLFLKNRTEENKGRYAMQRNLRVTLSRKSYRQNFNNLNKKNVCNNKNFWKVVKPLSSMKNETAEVVNEFFSNVVTNLNIPQFNQIDKTSENINDQVIKAIVKYRAHQSVIAIEENCTSKSNFNLIVENIAIE